MKKILIVDDDYVMLQIMNRILSKEYEIVSALSGEAALELFDREQPDMVLSDLRMPGMDGYELRCKLRKKSDVPFILMTADESDESERKGLDIGAADYIRKPANADVLLRRISNIMQNAEKIHGLKKAASIDAMTQLLNKESVRHEIGGLCQRVPGALLMIDLDSFKLVNDLHGHAMGDRILIRFAELIRGMIRSTDLAGRLGGDEFIAYLQHVADEEVIREKTAYLNEALLLSAREYMGEDMSIPLGASVGAVFVPSGGTDFSELCQKADQALYEAKKRGKHTAAFYGTRPKKDEEGESSLPMRQILGERYPEKGPLLLDFDGFQGVYRFISRLRDDFQSRAQFLQFDLPPEQEEAAMQFFEVLRSTLRRSDCIMQNGAFRFFVLLMDVGETECASVVGRIRAKWEDLPVSARCSFMCSGECVGERKYAENE